MAQRCEIKRVMFALSLLIMLVLSAAPIFVDNSSMSIDLQKSWAVSDQVDLPRCGNPGMVYDSESDRIVIFGGWNNTVPAGDRDDTWTYDFESDTYTKMNPSTKPPGRDELGFAYDSLRDEVVLFGGMHDFDIFERLDDTWKYDYNTNTWTEVFPTTAPSARRAHDMVYDSESDRFILFGGEDGSYLNDTWSYNPGTNVWTMMSPSIAPSARMSHKMAYDSESDRVILFGGYNGEGLTFFFDDTWAYDYNSDTWEDLTDTTNPSPRGTPSMAYDSESDRIVLFGGCTTYIPYNDTWIFDYNTASWVEQSPTTSPSARSRHGSAYDSQSDRVVIYGGTIRGFNSRLSQVFSGKTYAYDVNSDTWTEMQPDLPPTTTTTEPPVVPIEWIAIGAGIVVVALVVVILVKRR